MEESGNNRKDETFSVYFVRHGQTDWNRLGRTQGQLNIPLNDEGRRAAEYVGQRLATVPFEVVYSSPLSRALETAQIIVSHQANPKPAITEDKRLAEIDFGLWEGMTIEDIKKHYPKEWEDYRSNPLEHGPPGGESVRSLQERISSFLESILGSPFGGAKVLVVSHGALLRNCFYRLLGLDYRNPRLLRVDNTGITVFRFKDKRPQLVLFNDTGRVRDD